uniref:Uncharacterized protein n=1 Tax=Lepeophtheirus salmonis TaxID=72036 RepID=A0A0K2SXP8_LEPSM
MFFKVAYSYPDPNSEDTAAESKFKNYKSVLRALNFKYEVTGDPSNIPQIIPVD